MKKNIDEVNVVKYLKPLDRKIATLNFRQLAISPEPVKKKGKQYF